MSRVKTSVYVNVTKKEATRIIKYSKCRRFSVCHVNFVTGETTRNYCTDIPYMVSLLDGADSIRHGVTRGTIEDIDIYYGLKIPGDLYSAERMSSIIMNYK